MKAQDNTRPGPVAVPLDRLRTWEQRTGPALTCLAGVFLVVYAVPILWPALPTPVDRVCATANLLIWGVFWADYLTRFGLATDRARFVRRNLFDLAVLLLPVLRSLRVLRVVIAFARLERQAESWTRGKIGVYVAGAATLMVLIGGLAILDAERGNPGANITTYADGLWWAVVTMSTVGYGDHFPVTGTGRAVALALMVAGIGVLGFITGSITTWVLDRIKAVERANEETQAEIAVLLTEVRALRRDLRELVGVEPSPPREVP
jgi:voltage-gated potassium channel